MSLMDLLDSNEEKKEEKKIKVKSSSPKSKVRKMNLDEFLSLDAILRRHNHGKNNLNRKEIMEIIKHWCLK